MKEWLIINSEKDNYPMLKEFIDVNPELQKSMTRILANYLNLNDAEFQVWMNNYREAIVGNPNETSECMSTHMIKYKCTS